MIAKKSSPGKHVNTVRSCDEGLLAGRQKPAHCTHTRFLLQPQGLWTQEGEAKGTRSPLSFLATPARLRQLGPRALLQGPRAALSPSACFSIPRPTPRSGAVQFSRARLGLDLRLAAAATS